MRRSTRIDGSAGGEPLSCGNQSTYNRVANAGNLHRLSPFQMPFGILHNLTGKSSLTFSIEKCHFITALGKRIKSMRQNLGITQDKFAEMLNCTNSHIGKIENGKGGISIEMLVSVANILHTTVDQLLLDSYDYKEQVLLHDFYERIDKFPVQTKVLVCDMVMRLLDIIEETQE